MANSVALADGLFRGLMIGAIPASIAWAAIAALVAQLV